MRERERGERKEERQEGGGGKMLATRICNTNMDVPSHVILSGCQGMFTGSNLRLVSVKLTVWTRSKHI